MNRKIPYWKSRFRLLAVLALLAASTVMSSKVDAGELSQHRSLVQSFFELKELTATMVNGLAESQTDIDQAIIPVRENIQQQIALIDGMIEFDLETERETLADFRQALVSLEASTHGLAEIPDLKLFWEAISDLLMAWDRYGARSSPESL